MMEQGKKPPRKKIFRQKYFVARELQSSIMALVILSLLGGIMLERVADAITVWFGFETFVLRVAILTGYVVIVGFLAIFFSHRLIGPFKRLEHEMGGIRSGDLTRRLSVRTKDDVHVRNFLEHANDLIADFEEMRNSYARLNSVISHGLGDAVEKLKNKDFNPEELKKELKSLQEEVHKYRQMW